MPSSLSPAVRARRTRDIMSLLTSSRCPHGWSETLSLGIMEPSQKIKKFKVAVHVAADQKGDKVEAVKISSVLGNKRDDAPGAVAFYKTKIEESCHSLLTIGVTPEKVGPFLGSDKKMFLELQ